MYRIGRIGRVGKEGKAFIFFIKDNCGVVNEFIDIF